MGVVRVIKVEHLTKNAMFRIMKRNRLDELRGRYARLMQQARDIQRRGDKKLLAKKMEEAELVSLVIHRISMS